MPESFITRNVNVVLVILLFVLLAVLLGGSVYFQSQFQGLTTELAQRKAMLEGTNQSLSVCQSRFESAVRDLNKTINITEQEKLDLRQVYTFTKTDLGTTIQQLNSSLLVTQSTLELTKSQLDDKSRQLVTTTSALDQKTIEATSLTGQLHSCTSDLSHANSNLRQCKETCGDACG